jgi:hypothetical protein
LWAQLHARCDRGHRGSDRQANGQPFLNTAADQTSITSITSDGVIVMHNITWNFDSTVNATCVDNTMTAHIPGDGTLIVTLTDMGTRR